MSDPTTVIELHPTTADPVMEPQPDGITGTTSAESEQPAADDSQR